MPALYGCRLAMPITGRAVGYDDDGNQCSTTHLLPTAVQRSVRSSSNAITTARFQQRVCPSSPQWLRLVGFALLECTGLHDAVGEFDLPLADRLSGRQGCRRIGRREKRHEQGGREDGKQARHESLQSAGELISAFCPSRMEGTREGRGEDE